MKRDLSAYKFNNYRLAIFTALVVAFLLALSSFDSPAAENVRLTASVNRNKIGVSEVLQYTLSVQGARGRIELPTPPPFDGFDVIGSHRQQSTQIINGNFSSSFDLIFQLLPKKAGKFEIPAGSFNYKGQEYKSNTVTVEVLKGESKPQQQAAQKMTPTLNPQERDAGISENLFFKVSASKTNVVVNEPVLLTYGFYRRLDIYNGSIDFPAYSGFWVEDLDDEPELRETIVDGKTYLVQEWKKVIFPATTGTFEIGEAKLQIQTSPFQSPYQLKTNTLHINVAAFPEDGKPAGFSGAVGRFKVESEIDKKEIGVNEPALMKIKISGTGNVNSFDDIIMEFPPDIDVYESTSNSNTYKAETYVHGDRAFEYTILARAPGQYEIPPLDFSYYDYKDSQYKTIRTKPISLKVTGKAGEPVRSIEVVRDSVKALKREINYLKPADAEPLRKRGKRALLPYAAAFHALPLALLAFVFFARKRKDKLKSDVAYARSSRAKGAAAKQLRKARSLLKAGSEKEYFSEVAEAIRKYLADKINIAAESLIVEDALDALKDKLGQDLPADKIRNCVTDCDAVSFSSITPSLEDMKNTYKVAAEIINELERLLK